MHRLIQAIKGFHQQSLGTGDVEADESASLFPEPMAVVDGDFDVFDHETIQVAQFDLRPSEIDP